MVNSKVALKEEMNESTHDEPEESQLVSETTDGGVSLLVGESDGADGDCAKGGEEEGEGVSHGVGVGDVVVEDQVQGVVGVWCVCCCHCVCRCYEVKSRVERWGKEEEERKEKKKKKKSKRMRFDKEEGEFLPGRTFVSQAD